MDIMFPAVTVGALYLACLAVLVKFRPPCGTR